MFQTSTASRAHRRRTEDSADSDDWKGSVATVTGLLYSNDDTNKIISSGSEDGYVIATMAVDLMEYSFYDIQASYGHGTPEQSTAWTAINIHSQTLPLIIEDVIEELWR